MNDLSHRPPRSQALLDAIEAESPCTFVGDVWRVVTEGFDVLRPGRSGGRWDDGSFDVLYTSSEKNGAIAESWFHAARGQPVIPSKIKKRVYKIEVSLNRALDLSGEGKLASVGVAMAGYGRLSYLQRTSEYPTLQQIAEAAYFYEYQAIIVPNARWPTSNVVVFTEYVKPGDLSADQGEAIDLNDWFAGEGKTGMRS
ncbi:MAG: RES family NAD+ phosphorylase [Sphingorhabdus sp.]